MVFESAESMARPGGVHPSKVIEHLNSLNPQCPVQLQPLRFKPWQRPSLSRGASGVTGAGCGCRGGGDGDTVEDEGKNTEGEGKEESQVQ